MKQTAIFLSILSFTLLSAYLTFYSRTVEDEAEIARVVTFDAIAYSKRIPVKKEIPITDVLGTVSIRTQGVLGKTALQILMETHSVIIEHTEDGTRVISIDGFGLSTDERLSNKKWIYSVNGEDSAMSPDRYLSNPTDVIMWTYR